MKRIIAFVRDGNLEEWMGRISILLVIAPVVLNIINRSFFNFYSIPIETIALLSYVWIGYGFFGYLYKTDSHVDVKFIETMLPEKGKKIFELMRDIFIFAFSVYMTYWGFKLCKGNIHRYVIGTKISMVYAYSSIAFGFLSGSLRSGYALLSRFTKKNKEEEGKI